MENPSNNIVQRVYDSFGVLPPNQRTEKSTSGDAEGAEVEFVDLYQRDARRARAEAKKTRPNGSSPRVTVVVDKIVRGDGAPGLAAAHQRAKEDSDILSERGERSRADIVKQQYMEERFIPAVETAIRFSSPDEVLNCKEGLNMLDRYALGTGSMKGYTASYIRSAYGNLLGKDLDGRFNNSDPQVVDAVCRIKRLAGRDNIRTAVGLAARIKKDIDDGKTMASDEDYEIIGRVASFNF